MYQEGGMAGQQDNYETFTFYIMRLPKIRVRWIVLVLLLVFIGWVRLFPGAGESYARKVYPIVFSFLSRISQFLPFSLGDCFIYGSIVGLLLFLLYGLVVRRRRIVWRLGRIVEYLAWVYVWFYLAWGLNYFRQDFFTRSGVEEVPYSAERFQSFLTAYTDSLNASYVPMEQVDTLLIASAVQQGYRELSPRFGLLRPGKELLRSKPMLFSSLMSGVGVMGYMGPFFNEFNLNVDLLPVQYPAVYAHELSHLLGITSEAEANLYSYLVCTRSDIPEVRFSGYFSLFPYMLGNAYRILGKEAFEDWTRQIRPEIKELYNSKNAYWQAKYNPWIGEMQDKIYNFFLKGNNIPSGTANYSEVVKLVIACQATGENFFSRPVTLLPN